MFRKFKMVDESEEVELGFVEKTENTLRLSSPFFPSKVGGRPSWLDLENLPSSQVLICKICNKQMVFLLQIYAPVNDNLQCFHRTIFVFCCKNGKCYKKNNNGAFLALRNQLPRENKFYSSNAPPDLEDDENVTLETLDPQFRLKSFTCLCDVCGCFGDKKCSRCHAASYCCRDHQVFDWKAGHKNVCSKFTEQPVSEELKEQFKSTNKLLFPEVEIVTEPEPRDVDSKERSEEERMKDFEKMTRNLKNTDLGGQGDKELEKLAMEGKRDVVADKHFRVFRKRIARQPDQVLRYHLGGEPLWVSKEHQPSKGMISKCSCGADRQFEFQIMPQLLNHLGVDSLEESIDWGTVAIYTCSNNCDDNTSYHEEFIWKQDFTDTGIPGNTFLG